MFWDQVGGHDLETRNAPAFSPSAPDMCKMAVAAGCFLLPLETKRQSWSRNDPPRDWLVRRPHEGLALRPLDPCIGSWACCR